MSGSSWSPEQRRRIASFTESGDPSELAGEPINQRGQNASGPVSLQECREWRDHLRESRDHIPNELGKGYTLSTIRKHAYGRCSHPDSAAGEPADGIARRGGLR